MARFWLWVIIFEAIMDTEFLSPNFNSIFYLVFFLHVEKYFGSNLHLLDWSFEESLMGFNHLYFKCWFGESCSKWSKRRNLISRPQNNIVTKSTKPDMQILIWGVDKKQSTRKGKKPKVYYYYESDFLL